MPHEHSRCSRNSTAFSHLLTQNSLPRKILKMLLCSLIRLRSGHNICISFTPGPTTSHHQSCISSASSFLPQATSRPQRGVCPTKAVPAQSPASSVSEFRFPIPDPLVQSPFPLHSLPCCSILQSSGLRLLPPGSLQELDPSPPINLCQSESRGTGGGGST